MNRKLGRKNAHRDHVLRNLATSLVLYERIDTTEAKAKEVKSIVDRLISRAKKNDLEARRSLLGYFFDRNAVQKLLSELLPRYAERKSGFVKSYRLGNRLGDNSLVMRLELVDSRVFIDKKEKTTKSEKVEEKKEPDTTTTVKARGKQND